MCGRYYRKSDKQKIAEAFHISKVDDFPLPPWDYNIAPTSMQPIIRASRDTGEREPFKKRRCTVPVFGFYKWKKLDAKTKQPYGFDLVNGNMLGFAGLWDACKDPANGKWLQSYTIITTEANELMVRSMNASL